MMKEKNTKERKKERPFLTCFYMQLVCLWKLGHASGASPARFRGVTSRKSGVLVEK